MFIENHALVHMSLSLVPPGAPSNEPKSLHEIYSEVGGWGFKVVKVCHAYEDGAGEIGDEFYIKHRHASVRESATATDKTGRRWCLRMAAKQWALAQRGVYA